MVKHVRVATHSESSETTETKMLHVHFGLKKHIILCLNIENPVSKHFVEQRHKLPPANVKAI